MNSRVGQHDGYRWLLLLSGPVFITTAVLAVTGQTEVPKQLSDLPLFRWAEENASTPPPPPPEDPDDRPWWIKAFDRN